MVERLENFDSSTPESTAQRSVGNRLAELALLGPVALGVNIRNHLRKPGPRRKGNPGEAATGLASDEFLLLDAPEVHSDTFTIPGERSSALQEERERIKQLPPLEGLEDVRFSIPSHSNDGEDEPFDDCYAVDSRVDDEGSVKYRFVIPRFDDGEPLALSQWLPMSEVMAYQQDHAGSIAYRRTIKPTTDANLEIIKMVRANREYQAFVRQMADEDGLNVRKSKTPRH